MYFIVLLLNRAALRPSPSRRTGAALFDTSATSAPSAEAGELHSARAERLLSSAQPENVRSGTGADHRRVSWPITVPSVDCSVMTPPTTRPRASLLSHVSTPSHAFAVDATSENRVASSSVVDQVPEIALHPSLPEKVRSALIDRKAEGGVLASPQYPTGNPWGPTSGSVERTSRVAVESPELMSVSVSPRTRTPSALATAS